MENLTGELQNFSDIIRRDYYIADETPKVSSDGEPHEMLTMIAGLSGLIAAVIVLFILIILIDCRNSESNSTEQQRQQNQRPTVFTIFGSRKSIEITPNRSTVERQCSTGTETTEINLSTTQMYTEKFHLFEDTILTNDLTGVKTISC